MYSLLRALIVCAAAGGFAAGARADDKKPEKPGQPTKPEQPVKPGQPIIIQIDGSKLPPDVLKELLKLAAKPGEPTKPEPTKPGVKPEPTKPVLKPEVKPEPTKPGVKPESTKPVIKPGKTISLSDAVAIAEKLTQGTAVKAERKEEGGAVQFKIDVVGPKGEPSKVTLDPSGQVINADKKGDDKEESKKKKKK